MGRASSARHGQDRRTRIAAQRAAAQQAQRRNRMLIAGGAIVAVVAVVLSFVLLSGNSTTSTSSGGASAPPTGSALASVVTTTTTVPAATLDQVGAGQVSATPAAITGPPLTSGGKPEMLYMGAEYCPYCAAERWAMVVALSRFGTFSGLAAIRSAAKNGAGQAEPYPNTATWTFVNAHFASKYLTFTSVETNTNIPDPATGGYTTLQTPTAEQQALISKYDAAYNGAIPFIDYGNKYLSVGASYDPGRAEGADLEPDRGRPAQPRQPGGQGRARRRELHDRGDLQADRRPAGLRLHPRGEVAAGQAVRLASRANSRG